jgi:hypothetical protein
MALYMAQLDLRSTQAHIYVEHNSQLGELSSMDDIMVMMMIMIMHQVVNPPKQEQRDP